MEISNISCKIMDISKILSVGKNHHCRFTNQFPFHSAMTTNVNSTCVRPSWFPRRPAWLRHPWNHGPERCILGKKGRNRETPNFLVQKINFNYRQFYFPWKLFWQWVMSEILSHFLPKRVGPRGSILMTNWSWKCGQLHSLTKKRTKLTWTSYGNFVTNLEAHLRWRNAAKRPKCIAP